MKKLAFALLLAIAACDGGGGGGSGARIAEPPFVAANDVEYIDAIVPHHWAAVRMTDEVLARGARADVRALAQKMQADQLQEIHRLESIRLQLTGSAETPQVPDPHVAEDMERLAALSGDDLDRAFLEEMIAHHGTGIDVSHRALPALVHEEVEEIARDVFETQAREVGTMIEMLKPSS